MYHLESAASTHQPCYRRSAANSAAYSQLSCVVPFIHVLVYEPAALDRHKPVRKENHVHNLPIRW